MNIRQLGIFLTAAVMSFTILFTGCGKKPDGGGNDFPDPVNIADIPGVTTPVFGVTPDPNITPTDQYTGTVSWYPPLSEEGKFEANEVYTATITLTAKDGYTFDGVASNFFKVAGAETTSNAVNSGVVTAVFGVTGSTSPPPSNIKTDTIFEGTHTGLFTIAKSGNRRIREEWQVHADLHYDYIVPGGYIEANYTGNPPQLDLYSDQYKTGKDYLTSLMGEDSAPGVRRFYNNDILDTVYDNFGYLDVGTRNPTIMALIELNGADTITKVTITYNSNDPLLKTFDTVEEMRAAAITHPGNITRIKRAMAKAEAGQPITVAFLGGSITQAGSWNNGYTLFSAVSDLPGTDADGYAGKVARWFFSNFPNSEITYINHGSGGATSWTGLGWLDDFTTEWSASIDKGGLLKGLDGTAATRLHEPDMVFIEFSVNDSLGWMGAGSSIDEMIGRILEESNAGVMVLSSLDFYTGNSADVVHGLAAARHNVPVVNHRAALWPNLREGKTVPVFGNTLSYDDLHPVDAGHRVYADFINNRLNQIKDDTLSYVVVSGFVLNKSATTITVGEGEQLTASITPSNASNDKVIWLSNNTDVATVSSTGYVTTHSLGSATITARSDDAPHLVRTCYVTVEASSGYKEVVGVALNTTQRTFNLNTEASTTATATMQLTAIFTPLDADNQTVTWKSSNPLVATVDQNGIVSAWRSGETTITVTTQEGPFEAHCAVSVRGTVVPDGVVLTDNGDGTADAVLWEGDVSCGWYGFLFDIKSMDQPGGTLNPAWIVSGNGDIELASTGWPYFNWFNYADADGADGLGWESSLDAHRYNLYDLITERGVDPLIVKTIRIDGGLAENSLTKIVLRNIPYIAP